MFKLKEYLPQKLQIGNVGCINPLRKIRPAFLNRKILPTAQKQTACQGDVLISSPVLKCLPRNLLLTTTSFWKSVVCSTKPRVWQINILHRHVNHNLLLRCCLCRTFSSRKRGFLSCVLSLLACFWSLWCLLLLCLSHSRFLFSFSHNISPRCPSGTPQQGMYLPFPLFRLPVLPQTDWRRLDFWADLVLPQVLTSSKKCPFSQIILGDTLLSACKMKVSPFYSTPTENKWTDFSLKLINLGFWFLSVLINRCLFLLQNISVKIKFCLLKKLFFLIWNWPKN